MDNQIYTPTVIPDVLFPQDTAQSANTSQAASEGVYGPTTTSDTVFPTPNIASEVIGDTMNTTSKKILQEFQFTQSGAIQVGEFEPGVSGDLRFSPDGLVARDNQGDVTVAIDGETGNAFFKGIISALSVISGQISLGGAGNGDGFLKIFNDKGDQAAQGDSTGFTVYDLDSFNFFSSSANQKFGSLGADTSSNITLSAAVGVGFKVIASGATFQLGSSNQGTMQVNGNFSVSGSFNVGSFSPSSISTGDVNCSTLHVNGNRFFMTDGDASIGNSAGDVLIFSGSAVKTAIVPTTKGYKALYTNESPDVWFNDFVKAKKRKWWEFWKKTYTIYPDPLFLETIDKIWYVLPTVNNNIVQAWGKRKGFEETRFEEKTEEQFEKNNQFWSQAK